MKKAFLCLVAAICACSSVKTDEQAPTLPMDEIAERYVKTILKLGQYDGDIVDAYYGPEEWQPTGNAADSLPAAEFLEELQYLQQSLEAHAENQPEEDTRRILMFRKQLQAAITKVEIMQGKELPFDREAKLLYDANPPHFRQAYFDSLLLDIDRELPGSGPVAARWAAYRKNFEIPKNKLDTVFQAAIAEARKRTKARYELPEHESFRVEYVTDKPWSGYNYFQGNSYSLIQLNTDFAIYIERAIDLACHEGYPGHHVFNALLEQELVNKRGWMEYTVYPLFSPQSLIAEGSANYGIEVAFPAEDRLQFEQEVLFPLAGLDSTEADRYYTILEKIGRLDFAGNEAARRYLDGDISREEAAAWLVRYNFYDEGKALQRTRFFDRYRSYVINYNLGQQLVRNYIEDQLEEPQNTTANRKKRWQLFHEILSKPYTASMLQ